MISPLLAGAWVGFHTPALSVLLLLLYPNVPLAWYWILLQSALGYALSALVYRGAMRKENLLKLLLAWPALDVGMVLELLTSLLAVLAYSLLYHQVQSDDTVPLMRYGMLTATALVMSWYAVSHMARRMWFHSLPLLAPWEPQRLLVELTAWGTLLDAVCETGDSSGRLLLGVLGGVRLVTWAVHHVLFLIE